MKEQIEKMKYENSDYVDAVIEHNPNMNTVSGIKQDWFENAELNGGKRQQAELHAMWEMCNVHAPSDVIFDRPKQKTWINSSGPENCMISLDYFGKTFVGNI
ncbi:hypothetical protein JTB14_025313 [Gonioctena quinquepunctata]|nr:hypothetical protein JTB14_025313 [Gonioctena quinquepunctata]